MIKALQLIFNPVGTWERVAQTRRGSFFVLTVHLLPWLLAVCAAEGFGLVRWGKWQGQIPHLKRFTVNEAVIIQTTQFVAWLLVVFLGAILVKSLGDTFHGRHTFRQSFTVVAYGLSPFFLLKLLDVVPVISPWVTWAIGICLCLGALYQGVPKVMDPDPPHAFGLYLMSCVLLAFTTALVRFLTAWFFQGNFMPLQMKVGTLAERLPF